MSLDTVQNFFRLTLDNVYRFVCALFFFLAISSVSEGATPLQQTVRLLSWLAVPADWVGVVEAWLGERSDALISVSALALFIALCACLAESWLSRAGATVLLAIGFLIQAGVLVQLLWVVGTLTAGLAVGIAAVSAVRHQLGLSATSWLSPVFSRLQNLAPSLLLALLGAFGPLVWLVGEDRPRTGETRSTPVHVSKVN